MICPQCNIYLGHTASCPTQLQTTAQRVARAAHLYQCFSPERAAAICQADGLSPEEIKAGSREALRQRALYELGCRMYGDPAYGQWPAGAWKELDESGR